MAILRWSALALLLLAVVLVPFALWGERLDAWVADGSRHGGDTALPATVLAGLLVADGLLPVPSSLVSTLLGTLLGFAWGTLLGTAAMTGGVVLCYLLGRWGGRPMALRIVGSEGLARAADWLDRRGVPALALCRPLPVLAEASVIAAGAGGMPAGRVLATTALANLGLSAVYAGLGASAAGPWTFLLAVAAAFALPGVALLLSRRFRAAQG